MPSEWSPTNRTANSEFKSEQKWQNENKIKAPLTLLRQWNESLSHDPNRHLVVCLFACLSVYFYPFARKKTVTGCSLQLKNFGFTAADWSGICFKNKKLKYSANSK